MVIIYLFLFLHFNSPLISNFYIFKFVSFVFVFFFIFKLVLSLCNHPFDCSGHRKKNSMKMDKRSKVQAKKRKKGRIKMMMVLTWRKLHITFRRRNMSSYLLWLWEYYMYTVIIRELDVFTYPIMEVLPRALVV